MKQTTIKNTKLSSFKAKLLSTRSLKYKMSQSQSFKLILMSKCLNYTWTAANSKKKNNWFWKALNLRIQMASTSPSSLKHPIKWTYGLKDFHYMLINCISKKNTKWLGNWEKAPLLPFSKFVDLKTEKTLLLRHFPNKALAKVKKSYKVWRNK